MLFNLVYQVSTLLISLAAAPIFLLNGRGREFLRERYGIWSLRCNNVTWFHGASVGEINGLAPVIKLYKAKNPQSKILITSTSPAGRRKAAELGDYARLMPFDNYIWHRLAFSKIGLELAIIAETEIWPAQLRFLAARNVSVFLVNGRISDFSLPRYKLLKKILRSLLMNYKTIMVANAEAAERFLALGADSSKIQVTGNSKYDLQPSVPEGKATSLKYFSNNNPVLVLGSIRPGEELIWFEAVRRMQNEGCNFNLVVAPRHKEKFIYFVQQLKRCSLKFESWSELRDGCEAQCCKENILLLDTMGELEKVYSIASLAFIGATLVDLGGHNPLEPAAYKVCICVGPYYKNIREEVNEMLSKKAITVIKNSADAASLIKGMCETQEWMKQSGEAAYSVWHSNIGAAQRIVERLSNL